MSDNDLVKRLRAPAYWMSVSEEGHEGENDAPREAAAELTLRRERVAELEKVIAWANNSLYGSHRFFLSINGGKDNEHHLDEAIENLKQQNRDYWSRIAELEGNIKHKTELGAILSAAHLQNRSHIASLEATLDLYRDAVRIDPKMEGPRYAGANSSALRRAWEHDLATSPRR